MRRNRLNHQIHHYKTDKCNKGRTQGATGALQEDSIESGDQVRLLRKWHLSTNWTMGSGRVSCKGIFKAKEQ